MKALQYKGFAKLMAVSPKETKILVVLGYFFRFWLKCGKPGYEVAI